MKRTAKGVAVIAALCGAATGALDAQVEAGEKIFKGTCAACHTIGGGRLVGPDLQGLHERRSEAWIISFVQHPQQTIASGDTVAKALFDEFQGFAMPDQSLSPDEIREVLAYIRRTEAFGPAPVAATTPAATEEQIQLGEELFDGRTRFANGGAACHSCHAVTAATVIGGGSLARDLTTAFTRLGGAGVQAIISAPPFPVMQRAYRDRPLTPEEVVALTGFLEHVSAQQFGHHPAGFAPKLLAAGGTGTALLLLLYSLAWSKRSKGSVYQRIYNRQSKST